MYFSKGSYEAFAKPVHSGKAEGKSAYIIGSGMAALSAACFLVRDAGMAGGRIHILEKEHLPGGACDGYRFEEIGPIVRGDHKLDPYAVCLWDLLRSIPDPDGDGSVLDACYALNQADPNYTLCRATEDRGTDAHLSGPYGLTDKGCEELFSLFISSDEALADKKVEDVLDEAVLGSNFWFYWKTLFGFHETHSALELKLSIRRYMALLKDIPDMRAFLYTRYNLYDSVVQPVVKYLEQAGVRFHYGVHVTDVAYDCAMGRKMVTRIDTVENGEDGCIDVTERDLVFITLGSVAENSTRGSQDEAAPFHTEHVEGGSFELWRKIAAQDPSFGHPEVFCVRPEETNKMSATITALDGKVLPYIKKICRRDPFSGKTVTGGIVTAKDSAWQLSWSVGRQPIFRDQDDGQCVILLEALKTNVDGDYITKPMRECTGREICAEWLWHLGVPNGLIDELAGAHIRTVPVMMPYLTSPLLPRVPGDRPDVVPEGARNFAFIGQFAETDRDAAMSVEYAVRTGMEAVYTLLEVDRGVPETTGAAFDLRAVAEAASALRDGRSIRNMDLKRQRRLLIRSVIRQVRETDIEKLMKEYRIL